MTKIVLWNLPAGVSEDHVRAMVETYARVVSVVIDRAGDPERPLAIVGLALERVAAERIAHRLHGLWHEGRLLSANVLMHP